MTDTRRRYGGNKPKSAKIADAIPTVVQEMVDSSLEHLTRGLYALETAMASQEEELAALGRRFAEQVEVDTMDDMLIPHGMIGQAVRDCEDALPDKAEIRQWPQTRAEVEQLEAQYKQMKQIGVDDQEFASVIRTVHNVGVSMRMGTQSPWDAMRGKTHISKEDLVQFVMKMMHASPVAKQRKYVESVWDYAERKDAKRAHRCPAGTILVNDLENWWAKRRISRMNKDLANSQIMQKKLLHAKEKSMLRCSKTILKYLRRKTCRVVDAAERAVDLRAVVGRVRTRPDDLKAHREWPSGRVVGLYFGTGSKKHREKCGEFEQLLTGVYNRLRSQGRDFEVISVCDDSSASEFRKHNRPLPWLRAAEWGSLLGDPLTRARSPLFEACSVSQVPCLVLLDPDGHLVTKRHHITMDVVRADPRGERFPWVVDIKARLSNERLQEQKQLEELQRKQ